MNITIKDVAKAANVSVATVSRVLNNKNNVSEEAVQAVNRAVEELGYSPNFLGRDLRKSETKRILALIASTERSFYNDVLRGMQDVAYAHGYDILIASSAETTAFTATSPSGACQVPKPIQGIFTPFTSV